MDKHSISFDEVDEEVFKIYINGTCVGIFDHDTHGYNVMSEVRELMVDISAKLNIPIVDTGK